MRKIRLTESQFKMLVSETLKESREMNMRKAKAAKYGPEFVDNINKVLAKYGTNDAYIQAIKEHFDEWFQTLPVPKASRTGKFGPKTAEMFKEKTIDFVNNWGVADLVWSEEPGSFSQFLAKNYC